MLPKKAQKSKRLALFSENERYYLLGKSKKSTVGKSQFYGILDDRFDALLKDLDLLRTSKILENWRNFRAPKYHHHFLTSQHFENIFSNWKIVYHDAIRRVQKKKKSLFWLDNIPYNGKIDERMFESKYLFRHIRVELTDSDKNVLLLAYKKQNILPLKKEDSISLAELKKRLSSKLKYVESSNHTNDNMEYELKDPRNIQIRKIMKKHEKRNLKLLDKKLAVYDSSIIRYFIEPSYHPESA